jgi:hypothetical protein
VRTLGFIACMGITLTGACRLCFHKVRISYDAETDDFSPEPSD